MVINEMEVFPKDRYDDLTDSTTQAIKYIRDNGLLRTDQEEHVWAMDGVPAPLRLAPGIKALFPPSPTCGIWSVSTCPNSTAASRLGGMSRLRLQKQPKARKTCWKSACRCGWCWPWKASTAW